MSEAKTPAVGSIGWVDLTEADAKGVRDFYAAVTGWTTAEVPMGTYNDYCMSEAGGTAVAGVCHARGANADLPAQWLIYIVVAHLDQSLATYRDQGGALVSRPRSMGPSARYAVIRDPAGALAALYQPSL
jgi:predicted enzyme related to lactoylglutathione lyase